MWLHRIVISTGVMVAACCLATAQDGGKLSTFRPGELWPDNHGVHINAHGGGILFHEGTYLLVR